MKTTADEFRKKPHDVYRAADQGDTVTINHDRYRDKVFELTARGREPLKKAIGDGDSLCLLYTSPSPRDRQKSRMPSSA